MGLSRGAGEDLVTMRDVKYEPKQKRARRELLLKAGVWVLLAIFVLTSGGIVILGGFH